MHFSLHTIAIASAIVLTAPDRAQAHADNTGNPTPPKAEAIRITTPTSVMSMMTVAVEPEPGVKADLQPSPVGAYTRLMLKFEPLTPYDGVWREYDQISRNWFRRFFASKDISRLLTVKASLRRPQVTATATAISAGYQSGKKVGESWSSEVTGQRILTPYFRVDPGSGLNLELELLVSSSYNASFGADVIDLIRRATSLVAPASSLITSLNKERFTQASQFIDETLSSSMKESIVERSSNDFPMKVYAGKRLATVTLRLPLGNEITPNDKNPEFEKSRPIGTWTISADEPITSIFSTRKIGDAATDGDDCEAGEYQSGCLALRGRVTASGILNFPVDTGVTIAQALAGDSAVAAARDKVASTKEENASGAADKQERINADAKALCALVTDRLELLGFNRLDIAAVLWAYSRQSFGSDAASKSMQNETACPPLKLAYGIKLAADSTF